MRQVSVGRKTYSPNTWYKPAVRNETIREREYYPSPAKKQRVDYNYQEPERRLVQKPVQKIPEPKAAPVVIEKRPVLFNASTKNVPDYPPLPQRKLVQRQPKIVPQPQPIKNVVEKQPPKPVVEKQPPKPVVEKQPPKPVADKQPLKPVHTPPAKPVQKQALVEKKQEAKLEPVQIAAEAEAPSVEPCPDGHSQLSALMSHALSEELQLVMDMISKELPKEVPTAAERFVVKKFRTVVLDDIRNALGLNVTKRLLNLHNPLYVKLHFSGKPEAGCLQPFISEYNLSAFKRIEAPGDTFAARLDTVADFDRLCAAKEVACGSATVTVTPCYKYLDCPPTLKTIYGTYIEPVKVEKQDSNSPSKQTENTAEKTGAVVSSTEDDKKVSIKQEVVKATDDAQKVSIKQEVVNEATVSDNQKVVVKQEVIETIKLEAKAVTSDKNAKTVEESPVKVNITIQGVSKKSDVNTACKELNEINIPKEADKPTNNKTNVVDKSNKEVKNISMEDVSEDGLGEDEMNGQDILALMSGGIVLDECSGSDDEK